MMPQARLSIKHLSWVEIDLQAVRHNYREIHKLAQARLSAKGIRKMALLPVVKADAYGHGMTEVARAIEQEGARFFAVSNLDEAIVLRNSGNQCRVLLLEAALPELAEGLLRHNLTPALCSMDLARELDRRARRVKKKFPVHVKVDTGMGRLGVWHAEAVDFIRALAALPGLQIEGVLTHFPSADSDRKLTEQQIRIFSGLIDELAAAGISLRYAHAANSMGLSGYQNRFFNLARPGVMLYGLYPAVGIRRQVALEPVMSVKVRVLLVKTIHKGRGISYGHTYRAVHDTRVAVLAIGYSDGYSRSFSNKAQVLINGVLCPVRGRVTMDQTVVDISRAGAVSVGDEAVVLGRQDKKAISADDLAGWAGTINYEIVCNLGNRMPRVYVR